MPIDLQLAPKHKRAAGEPCCEPVVYPDVERHAAERMAAIAKALGDPIRLQLVDVLRKHAGQVCVCELVPLFDVAQPTPQPPPQEAARGRHRRLRATRAVGLLLRDPRRPRGVLHMADLTDRAAEHVREAVRERYAAAAQRTGEGCGSGCGLRARRRLRRAASTTSSRPTAPRRRRSAPRWAAACPPRWPTCTRARRCSTSDRAPAPTCSSAPAAWARQAARSALT